MSLRALLTPYLAIVLALFATPLAADSEQLLFRVAGSNTVGARLAPFCARDYLTELGLVSVEIMASPVSNEQIIRGRVDGTEHWQRIAIAAHGSSTGFKALLAGQADVVISSRPIKAKEVQKLVKFGDMRSPQSEHTVAIDGLALLVHPSNPVASVTVQQAAQIFSAEINNWQQLGGEDLPITLYARDHRSGTWDTFKNLVLGSRYQLHDSALRFESNDALSDRVAADVGAIGFASLASVRKAKLLAVGDDNTQPLLPRRLTVATEDYPLSRRLFIYQPSDVTDQSEHVGAFIEHCLSERGQALVAEVGFVTQNIIAVDQPVYENAPEVYQRLADRAQRLSLNFRFNNGSSLLDNKALKDIERVTQYLSQPEQRGRNVYLVGFTDANNEQRHDQLIARFRALSVQAKLMREKIAVTESYSLGAFMPIASQSNNIAKLKNARVEIWIERSVNPLSKR